MKEQFQKSSDYYYPGTKILKNNYNVSPALFQNFPASSDVAREEACQMLLNSLERKVVSVRMLVLIDNPIHGDFDFNHLKSIHKFLFQDIYPWAGEIRACDISKKNLFCRVMFIDFAAKEIFKMIKDYNYFINMSISDKKYYIVKTFSDINALHPFREGNGRTQREFVEELSKINGLDLDLTTISQNDMIKASHLSMLGDNTMLEKLFNELFVEVSLEQQIDFINAYCSEELASKLITNLRKRVR